MDASNAFNSLNRLSAVHNIRRLCSSLGTALINSYKAPTELCIDGDVLYSSEGTTQLKRTPSCYAHVRSGYNSNLHCHLGDAGPCSGNGTASTAMTVPVFEGEKWRRLDSNLNLRYGMSSSSASP